MLLCQCLSDWGHQCRRSSSILIFFTGYVWQTCLNQTKTFHTLICISLDSPGAATQPCSRVNTFHWPLNCGISSMPYLRVQCETLSGQHPVGQVHSSQLLAEEKTSTDWWFNATWSQFNQIIHQRSPRWKSTFVPPYVDQFISFYQEVMWNAHTAHGRTRLHLALFPGGPPPPMQRISTMYNHARTSAASELGIIVNCNQLYCCGILLFPLVCFRSNGKTVMLPSLVQCKQKERLHCFTATALSYLRIYTSYVRASVG